MGYETIIQVTQEETIAIDIGIAVDAAYLPHEAQASAQVQTQHSFPPFDFFLLPPELRAIVIDDLVHSAITTSQPHPKPSIINLKTSPPLWQHHEAWLAALSTLRNVVAADVEFAARIFDSIGRLQPRRKPGWAERQRDDCLSELLHAVRLQLCLSHALQILGSVEADLSVFRKRPWMRRDLWRKAPGPVGEGRARDAWVRLYGG